MKWTWVLDVDVQQRPRASGICCEGADHNNLEMQARQPNEILPVYQPITSDLQSFEHSSTKWGRDFSLNGSGLKQGTTMATPKSSPGKKKQIGS